MHPFTALADPTRRKIIEHLAAGPLAAGDIAAYFPISAPAISQHLGVLKDAKLVAVTIDAQRRIYDIDPQGFREMDEWRARIRTCWRARAGNAQQSPPTAG